MSNVKVTAVFTLLAVAALPGCASMSGEDLLSAAKGGISDSSSFGSGPEQVWVDKAKAQYRAGNFGLAERYYRQAVEERYNNVEAWLGLAASYDQLKRFDHADRAYQVVVKLVGHTPAVLNNLGYHYMLKGDLVAAERALRSAQQADPDNPFIRNNIAMLAEWKAAGGQRSG
jgi:Flp pilus assembly protein TadD